VGLAEYNKKRNFKVTAEPPGDLEAKPRTGPALEFVIQKHAASHLHYDFRLELDGVLLSWSVPRGPSLDPKVKRLAMHVEDHPLAYADFEGIIPKGQYGGGTVLLWDRGTWEPVGDPRKEYAKGNLKFHLKGSKISGGFALVKLRGRGPARRPERGSRWASAQGDERSWLLIKERDAHARDAATGEITDERPESVTTGRSMEEIVAERTRVWHSKPAHVDTTDVPGARAAPLPAKVHPPRVAGRPAPPAGEGWLHEMAVDGERLVARSDKGTVKFLSRKGEPIDAAADREYAPLVEAVRMLPAETLIVDGVVAPMSEGSKAIGYFLFDLPYLDGQDLTRTPLERRKALLEELIRRAPQRGPVGYLEHIAGGGTAFFREACRLGIPAMVSRRADSPYGASAGWVRVPCKAAHTSKKKVAAPAAPAARASKVKVTTPERVLWPDVAGGFTKAQLVQYYEQVADYALPQLIGRPLSLLRCPEGMPKNLNARPACFYMKHFGTSAPPVLERVKIEERSKIGEYLVARDLDGLVALAQMSILEIHPWNATVESVEAPDRVIFDLDPDPSVPWARVVETAFELRRRLAALDLDSVVKTTGGKGLHVLVPFAVGRGAAVSWDEAFGFSLAVAQQLERDQPGSFVTTMSKAKRVGKIFIDCFRNQRGNTAVAAYSTRARPGAPVAVPLTWKELSPALDPRAFTVETVPARLADLRADPWASTLAPKQKLTAALLRRLNVSGEGGSAAAAHRGRFGTL
jgi:bifunctional non-homologous end joining protein LigD